MPAQIEADGLQVESSLPRVRVMTQLGDLVILVDTARAPLSSAAFLKQVDEGAYDQGEFWRSVRRDTDKGLPTIEVVQASASTREPPEVTLEPTSQTGLRHVDGTVSLPRGEGMPSSLSGFFVCLGDQPGLDAGSDRNADRKGFAAFGRVIEGMDVARQIHAGETSGNAPMEFVAGQMLAEPVRIYGTAREPEDPGAKLSQLADHYWAFRVREFPIEASSAGVSSANALMDGATEEDHLRRALCARAMLKRATAIRPNDLTNDNDKVTRALLQRQLELIVEGFELNEHYRALLFPFGFADVPTMLAQQTPLLTSIARDAFAQRLAAVPKFLRDSLDVLYAGIRAGHRVPRSLLPRILEMIDSHLAPSGLEARISQALHAAVPGLSASQADDQRTRILRIVGHEVLPALRNIRDAFASFDKNELSDSIAVSAQPKGRDYYRYKVRQQTSLDLDPDAVHQLGLEEIARINGELDAVLNRMGRPDERHAVAGELDARVASDGSALLAHARATAKRIDGLIPRLIGAMPRNTYAVESMTPETSSSQPPALAQPAPADRSMPGIYWLTALPEKCPLHLIIPLTLHEAWPGHLMQLGLAHELGDLPEFRRFCWMDYNAYVEGWALYCERLGHDVGLYGNPADHFGLLTFELWRAARLVVDTGIHWKGWSRKQAIGFLSANSFLPLPTVESEVDRYIGMPAQALSYKIGERMIDELRRRAESTLGHRFSLREFNDAILATGPVTLEILKQELGQWIERQGASPRGAQPS